MAHHQYVNQCQCQICRVLANCQSGWGTIPLFTDRVPRAIEVTGANKSNTHFKCVETSRNIAVIWFANECWLSGASMPVIAIPHVQHVKVAAHEHHAQEKSYDCPLFSRVLKG